MNRLILFVCVLLAVFAGVCPCAADSMNGVLATERVINLPQDQGLWYVSVVGAADDANYQRVLGWFNTDAKMKSLRDAVHFNPVTTDTAIYSERYVTTGQFKITALPCVRLQKPDGTVIYQAGGMALPMSAQGLYGALASKVRIATGMGPRCPWRRPQPQPQPQPQPEPNTDPEPQPLEPTPIEPPTVEMDLPPVWLTILMLVVGAGAGVVYQWKKTYAKK